MKTAGNKCGIYTALTVALLALTALVTGCWSPNSPEAYPLQESRGSIRLIFNDSVSRTILPGHQDIDDYDNFEFYFTETINSTTLSVITRDKNTKSSPIPLDVGTYDLEIIATGSAAGVIPAVANLTNIQVSTSNTVGHFNTFSVTLKILTPNETPETTGDGIFRYKVNYAITNGGFEEAEIVITKVIDGSTEDTVTLTGTSGETDDVTLPAGYYYAELKITVRNSIELDNGYIPPVETFASKHVLHIHKNGISDFTYSFNYNGVNGYINTGFVVLTNWVVKPIPNFPLALTYDPSDQVYINGRIIHLSKNTNDKVTLRVVTKENFDGPFEWYFNQSTMTTSGSSFTVATGSSGNLNTLNVNPFDASYNLSVVGYINGVPYYEHVLVMIMDDTSTMAGAGGHDTEGFLIPNVIFDDDNGADLGTQLGFGYPTKKVKLDDDFVSLIYSDHDLNSCIHVNFRNSTGTTGSNLYYVSFDYFGPGRTYNGDELDPDRLLVPPNTTNSLMVKVQDLREPGKTWANTVIADLKKNLLIQMWKTVADNEIVSIYYFPGGCTGCN